MAKKKEVDNSVENVENTQDQTAGAPVKKKPKTSTQTNTQLSARTATN